MKKNFTNGIKALSLVIMLAFIAPVIVNAQAGKANFAGNWAFNAEKSQLGQGGGQGGARFGGGNMVVKQEANLLTVETTRPGRDGGAPTPITSKYTLDGKESVNTTQRGTSKSVATWAPDGKSLKITTSQTFDMNGETRTMNSSEVWTLNGANLSIARTRTTQNGDMTTTMVYDKK